jgi:hypothetical protein
MAVLTWSSSHVASDVTFELEAIHSCHSNVLPPITATAAPTPAPLGRMKVNRKGREREREIRERERGEGEGRRKKGRREYAILAQAPCQMPREMIRLTLSRRRNANKTAFQNHQGSKITYVLIVMRVKISGIVMQGYKLHSAPNLKDSK